MTESIAGITGLIAATAERLRLAQIDLADESPEVRRSQFSEEIRQSLSSINETEWSEFLRELRRRFPTWDGSAELAPPAPPAPVASEPAAPLQTPEEIAQAEPAAEPETDDPQALAARLLSMAGSLTPEQRRAIAEQLDPDGAAAAAAAAAALDAAPSGPVTFDPKSLQAFRKTLQMRDDEVVEPDKVLALAQLLADFSTSLSQLIWATWRTIAPQSTLRRSGLLQKTISKFTAGDQVDAEQMASEMDRLRQLIASLVAAISQAGQQFASAHLARFAPAEIENAVQAESGRSILRNRKEQCWNKFVDLSDMLDQNFIETELRRVIADNAEQLMKGLRVRGEAEQARPSEPAGGQA